MIDVYASYWTMGRKGQNQPISDHLRNLHRLSAHHARKHYGNITLLTDSAGAIELSGVGYDAVEVVLDNVDCSYSRVWSLGKLHAYKHIAEKGRPFLHLDYDVILHKPLPARITEAAVFTQSVESFSDPDPFAYGIGTFVSLCPSTQVPLDFQWPTYAWNMGIFGGHDCSFIGSYTDRALALVYAPENKDVWLHDNILPNTWSYATIPEQYYLQVECYVAGMGMEALFDGWPSPENARAVGYTHLMSSKNAQPVVERVAQLCQNL